MTPTVEHAGSDRRSRRPAGGTAGRTRSRAIRWLVVALVVAVLATFAMARWRTGDAGAPSEVVVGDAIVAETPLGFAAAVYLTIEQRGGDDRLVGASSPVAGAVSLHEMEPLPGGGLMLSTDSIELPSGTTVSLEPFGSHVMLEELVEPLVAGVRVALVLEFDRADPVEVDVEVIDLDRLATLGED